MSQLTKTRVDKWLWAIRVFKSRSMATEACRMGRVRINNVPLKASFLTTVGNVIEVKKNGFNLSFRVLNIIEKRVSAPLAILAYENITPEEEMLKYKDWFIGKSGAEYRDRGEGRPTKKDRREIDDFKDMFDDDIDLVTEEIV